MNTTQSYRVDTKVVGTTFVLSEAHKIKSFNQDVGPSSNWSFSHIESGQRICNPFNRCLVPFHKCLFYRLRFRLPLNKFKVGVLNHLRVFPSQLRLVSWAYMKCLSIGVSIGV